MQKTLQERTLIDDFLFFAMLNDEVIGEEFGRYLLEIFFDRKFGKRGNPSKGLRELLEYMEDTQKENVKNDTLRVIHNMVNVVKQNKKVSVEYMKIFEKEQMLWELGFEEGQSKKLTEQVEKKLAKGYSVEEIADMLEESIEVIRKILEKLKNEK